MSVHDLEAVVAIEKCSFPTPWTRGMFERERRRPHSHLFVLKERKGSKENIVGYICLWQVHDELRIPNLAVHPAFRRQGIATELLYFAFDLCTQENVKKVSLEVRAHNQSAQRLYLGLGFQFVGRRTDYYRDTGEDALLLERDISAYACSRPVLKEEG